MIASTSARSFSGRQLRIAISRRTSVGVSEAATWRKRSRNRAAHSRIWIEQEQNRDAARFGATGERQGTGQSAAGFRRQGMTAFHQ